LIDGSLKTEKLRGKEKLISTLWCFYLQLNRIISENRNYPYFFLFFNL